MIEIIDNAVQLTVTTCCAVWAGVLAFRHKSQHYSILACFYGTFALGLLFWLSYLVIMTYTPKIFYVSDLSWFASFLFLLLLSTFLVAPEKKGRKPVAVWLVTAVLLGVSVCFAFQGDFITTLLWCPLLIASGYYSTIGLCCARKQADKGRQKQWIHLAVLFLIFAEFTLWTISYFYKSPTMENLYYLCDFVLTVALFLLMPAMKQGVRDDIY